MGLRDACLGLLLFDLLSGLRRGFDIPHFGKCVHVERQIVKLVLINRHRGIHEIVELRKTVYVIPDLPVARMKDMRAVGVHRNSVHILAVSIARNVIPPVDYQAGASPVGRLSGKYGTEQAGSHNEIIIHFPVPP